MKHKSCSKYMMNQYLLFQESFELRFGSSAKKPSFSQPLLPAAALVFAKASRATKYRECCFVPFCGSRSLNCLMLTLLRHLSGQHDQVPCVKDSNHAILHIFVSKITSECTRVAKFQSVSSSTHIWSFWSSLFCERHSSFLQIFV
jgi:hypothetical protein